MGEGFKIHALGEFAIRCHDYEAMIAFYRDILALEQLIGRHRDGITFFKFGESYGGHVQVLALFRSDNAQSSNGPPYSGEVSSLHHFALAVDRDDLDTIANWFDEQGLIYHRRYFEWTNWSSIFTKDPDGNVVELVSGDPNLNPAEH